MHQRRAAALGRVLVSALVCLPAAALPTYEIVPLGLTDPEHTRNDGYQLSVPGFLTASGYVVGSSDRYNGGAAQLGQSAWFFDVGAATTTRLGFFDAEHTWVDGTQRTEATRVTTSGYVAGISERYTYGRDPEDAGASAWLYDAHADSTTRIGYFDASHTSADGFQRSDVFGANESGQAIGVSLRFAGATWLGLSAWLYDAGAGTTTRLGYFDAAHTKSDGYQSTTASMLTESGYVIGQSASYSGATNIGNTAWLYDAGGAATTRLGFYDAAHTGSNGEQVTFPRFVTEPGDAIGVSYRFPGGISAWYYDSGAGTTTRIGLFDFEHSSNGAYQRSNVSFATDSGYAAGTSDRFFTAISGEGQSAWIFDSHTGTTTRIGFFDEDHTNIARYQYSNPNALSESGYVIGSSNRYTYTGTEYRGKSAWLYDAGAGTTTRIGLFDAAHTRNDGYQFSDALRVTDSGYAAGESIRYAGATFVGHSSWIYRVSDQSQHVIVLSERSDGYAESSIAFLAEDGLALGQYELFAEDDTSLGDRAFAWTPDDGAFDLGSLVLGGLTAAGWDALASAIRANGLAQILGSGRLSSGGDLAYLLVAVPEPATGLLVSLGVLGLAARRRCEARARAN